MSLADDLREYRLRVEATLEECVPDESTPPEALHRAMRYTLMAAGKRVRPILTLMTGEMFGARPEPLQRCAAAVEMVHASSLILDDLPCMDDAEMRRGELTNHRVFGESTALLAALGLLNRSFEILAALHGVGGGVRSETARVLAGAIGSGGLIAGQVVDLERQAGDLSRLEFIHSHKTGRLFCASAEIGAIVAGAGSRERQALVRFAKNLGLAFQITDDLLDATASSETLGKDVRKDKGMTTFVTLCGADGARALGGELFDHAITALDPLGRRAEPLRALTERIRHRVA